jgi:uncharacterized protein
MLGFSLSKLLVLILIVAAIWYGFKWIGRLDRERKAKLRESESGRRDGTGRDLVQCAACGTYVTEWLGRCPEGRRDCPMVRS